MGRSGKGRVVNVKKLQVQFTCVFPVVVVHVLTLPLTVQTQ